MNFEVDIDEDCVFEQIYNNTDMQVRLLDYLDDDVFLNQLMHLVTKNPKELQNKLFCMSDGEIDDVIGFFKKFKG